MQQSNFITKCDRLLLQSMSGITKTDRSYYNVRQVLQSVTVITKRDVTQVISFILTLVLKAPSPFQNTSQKIKILGFITNKII